MACGLKVISGSLPGTFKLWLRAMTSGGSSSDGGDLLTAPAGTPDANHRRFHVSHTITNSGGTAAYIRPGIYFDDPSGTVACTFRIYAPQIEKKAYSTSPILPEVGAPAATTRAADVADMTVTNWHNPAAFTLFMGVLPILSTTTGYTASTPFALTLEPTTGTVDYVAFFQSGATFVPRITASSANITAAWGGTTPISLGTSVSMAIGYAPDDMAHSSTGTTQLTDAGGTLPDTLTRLSFADVSGGSVWKGFYQSLRYFPGRLTNAELETAVGN